MQIQRRHVLCWGHWPQGGILAVVLAATLLTGAVGLRAQDCGMRWFWASQTPVRTPMVGLSAGGPRLVAVGDMGAVIASEDGTSWSQVLPFTTAHFRAIAFGNSVYLARPQAAPSSSEPFWTSLDGLSWHPVPGLPSSLVATPVFAGDRFFTTGDKTVYSSFDGTAWVPCFTDANSPVVGVAFGQGRYVLLNSHGALCSSTDANTWVQRRAPDSSTYSGLAFGNGTFVACGGAGRILVSSDGTDWSQSTAPTTDDLSGVQFAGSYFFALMTDSGPNYLTSPDGISWQNVSGPGDAVTSVAFAGGSYYLVGSWTVYYRQNILVLASGTDGIHWTRLDSSVTTSNLTSGATGGHPLVTVVVGDAGTILTSPDGISWTARVSGATATLSSVAWGNGRFVAVGHAGVILTSVDGTTWSGHPPPTTADLSRVNWLNDRFIAVGTGGTLLTSGDGLHWVQEVSGTSMDLYGSTFGEGRYVVTGYNGTILNSTDAASWTVSYSDSSSRRLSGVAYGNGVFVTTCDREYLVSTDGIHWQLRNNVGSSSDITFWNGEFVAVLYYGAVSSPDGETWVTTYGGFPTAAHLCALDDKLLFLGPSGSILWSDCGPITRSMTPAQGSTNGGETITLEGTPFGGVEGVYFGGTPASSFTVRPSGQVFAITPAHAYGDVKVEVRTGDGYAQPTQTFTYIMPPTLQSVTPSAVSVLGGSTVNLSGNWFQKDANWRISVTFDGYQAIQTEVQGRETIVAVVPPHPASVVDVRVTNPDGQSSTLVGGLTYVDPPVIQSVKVQRNPFQLKIEGHTFHPSCTVYIDNVAVPKTVYKDSTRVLAKGSGLQSLFPPGKYWSHDFRVVNDDDGMSSPNYPKSN